jgi:hypothetical protein
MSSVSVHAAVSSATETEAAPVDQEVAVAAAAEEAAADLEDMAEGPTSIYDLLQLPPDTKDPHDVKDAIDSTSERLREARMALAAAASQMDSEDYETARSNLIVAEARFKSVVTLFKNDAMWAMYNEAHRWGLSTSNPFVYSFNPLIADRPLLQEIALHVIKTRGYHHDGQSVYRREHGLYYQQVGHAGKFLQTLFANEGERTFAQCRQILRSSWINANDCCDQDGYVLANDTVAWPDSPPITRWTLGTQMSSLQIYALRDILRDISY